MSARKSESPFKSICKVKTFPKTKFKTFKLCLLVQKLILPSVDKWKRRKSYNNNRGPFHTKPNESLSKPYHIPSKAFVRTRKMKLNFWGEDKLIWHMDARKRWLYSIKQSNHLNRVHSKNKTTSRVFMSSEVSRSRIEMSNSSMTSRMNIYRMPPILLPWRAAGAETWMMRLRAGNQIWHPRKLRIATSAAELQRKEMNSLCKTTTVRFRSTT